MRYKYFNTISYFPILKNPCRAFSNPILFHKKKVLILFVSKKKHQSYKILIILRLYRKTNFTTAEAIPEIIKYEGELTIVLCGVDMKN